MSQSTEPNTAAWAGAECSQDSYEKAYPSVTEEENYAADFTAKVVLVNDVFFL